jgi:hypothetical protein
MPTSPESGSEHLYFAFGSNLHLDQMRRRCPNSRYIGRAQLHDYRFQINSRGYANVLASAGDCVEGLVYLLTADDELRLDKNEGVSMMLYEKLFLPIEVYTASINHVGRLVVDVAQELKDHRPDYSHPESFMIEENYPVEVRKNGPLHLHNQLGTRRAASADGRHKFMSQTTSSTNDQARMVDTKRTSADSVSFTFKPHQPVRGQITKALVYVSLRFQKEGQIREEYVQRMNAGISDARKLGVSDLYLRRCLRPHIPEQPWLNKEVVSAQKRQSDKRTYPSPAVRLS